jgi:prepilin peptidase CpaA
MHPSPCFELLAVALVLAAALCDLARRRIPNQLLLLAWAFAGVLHVMLGTGAWLSILGGAAVGLVLFLPMYVGGGMAAGDVKLMATVGAVLGPWTALKIALASFCLGGLMAVFVLAAGGRLYEGWSATLRLLYWHRQRHTQSTGEVLKPPSVGALPYAVAVALGTLVVLVWFR